MKRNYTTIQEQANQIFAHSWGSRGKYDGNQFSGSDTFQCFQCFEATVFYPGGGILKNRIHSGFQLVF